MVVLTGWILSATMVQREWHKPAIVISPRMCMCFDRLLSCVLAPTRTPFLSCHKCLISPWPFSPPPTTPTPSNYTHPPSPITSRVLLIQISHAAFDLEKIPQTTTTTPRIVVCSGHFSLSQINLWNVGTFLLAPSFNYLHCLCSGNFIGQSPYISGASCSGCGQSSPFCVSNLCCECWWPVQIMSLILWPLLL